MPISPGFRSLQIIIVVLATAAGFPAEVYSQLSEDEFARTDKALRDADQFQQQGKHQKAIDLLEATLARVKRLARPGDQSIGAVSSGLGRAYAGAGRFAEAVPHFQEAMRIGRELPGEGADLRYSALNGLVACLTKLARFEEALPLCQESLKEVEARYGADDERTNMARDTLAQLYLALKRPADVIPIGRQCLKFAEAKFKPDSPETIRFRHTLAVALMQNGEYAKAKLLFEQSLAIAKKSLRPNDEMTTATENGLASVNQLMGRTADSFELALKQLANVEARPESKPEDIVIALNTLAVTAQSTGREVDAEKYFKRALDLSRAKLGLSHPTTAAVLANHAGLLIAQGKFADAERDIQESLQITKIKPGSGTVAHAKGLVTLAGVYAKTFRTDKAATPLEEAQKILDSQIESGNPEIAAVRHNIAMLSMLNKDYKKAAADGETALKEMQKGFGGDNRSTALVMVGIGQSYVQLKDYEKARARIERAIEILEAERGTALTDLILARDALAQVYAMEKKFDQAEAIARKNLIDCQSAYVKDHPDIANATDNLAAIFIAQGRYGEAFELFDSSRRSRREFLLRTLPTMTDADQFILLDSAERISRDFALATALIGRKVPGVAARSAEWVINSKSLTIRASALSTVLSRDAKNPEAIEILDELNATRARLSQLALSREKSGRTAADIDKEYGPLAKKELELAHQLGLKLGKPVLEEWTKLDQVRAALPADSVFVEFAKILVTESKLGRNPADPKVARYAAWVIPPAGQGEVKLVDLGLAETLENAISEATAAIKPPGKGTIKNADQPVAERKAMAALQVLSDRLYVPLKDELQPAKRWVLGLDASLWLVPWAALPVSEGRYAVEDHLIHTVINGNDLLLRETGVKPTNSVILADPDYDLGVGQALAIARREFAIPVASRGPTSPTMSMTKFFGEARVRRLEGTGVEANEVARHLLGLTGTEPTLYVQEKASESLFKSLQSPKILLLGTHGFSFPPPVLSTSPDSASTRSAKSADSLANPMLRCGLLLAGFNQRSLGSSGSSAGDLDDGILTGLEVVGVDLRGTELVVLSACETARGDLRDGEGIASLRQIFQIAGAQSVVATLWQVPDSESYQLISGFFQGIARRQGPATALREAQLALIAERRARLGSAHPYYWSAYELTGSPGKTWSEEALKTMASTDLPELPKVLPDSKTTLDDELAPSSVRAIFAVTGRPLSTNRWLDGTLALALAIGSGFLARWWWRRGLNPRL
jgi:CHAT domain-containing protein/tetratricopeptide (TPR) repeat protein